MVNYDRDGIRHAGRVPDNRRMGTARSRAIAKALQARISSIGPVHPGSFPNSVHTDRPVPVQPPPRGGATRSSQHPIKQTFHRTVTKRRTRHRTAILLPIGYTASGFRETFGVICEPLSLGDERTPSSRRIAGLLAPIVGEPKNSPGVRRGCLA